MVEQLNSKNVVLKALDQQFGISSISGKLMLGILGLVAEFENDIRRERQMEGIRKAQAEGRYKTGRKKTIDREKVLELLDQGLSQNRVAKQLGIGVGSVNRIYNKEKRNTRTANLIL